MQANTAECSIGLNCSDFIEYYSSSVCPNVHYCDFIAKPWNLPYIYGEAKDGTKILRVRFGFGSLPLAYVGRVEKELAQIGYAVAIDLPYTFLKTDNNDKALLVNSPSLEAQKEGWFQGDILPEEYYHWCMAKTHNNFSEYEKLELSSSYYSHWLVSQTQYYLEPDFIYPYDQVWDIPF